MARWHFNLQRPCDKARDSVSDEFFSTEGIKDSGEAVVREGIQNSLDASKGGKVTVSIHVSGQKGALPATSVAAYIDGAWEHIRAPGSGLRQVPSIDEPCPFLVFEDFGTTGLTGDIKQFYPPEPGVKNAYYHFFRAEGRSDKGESDRGRWGVGKHVFMRASRVRSILALTTRSDDNQTVLMGTSVFKSRRVGEKHYLPDGWFGTRDAIDDPELPIEDMQLLDKFAKVFRLQRKKGETGLSIVVPWCDPELDQEKLVEAAARDYFYPILGDKLDVVIDAPDLQTVLDSQTFIGAVKDQKFASELLPLFNLAGWSLKQGAETLFHLKAQTPGTRPKWSKELLTDELLKTASNALRSGQNTGFRVPLTVHEKGKPQRESFFDIFVVADAKYEDGHPVFLREGINISDLHARRARGYRSLVVVEDSALATMLGDSENPAHTQWQKDGSNFRGKYELGPSTISFVVTSVAELVRLLVETETEEDENLLLDVFSIPAQDVEGIETKKDKQKEKKGDEPSPPPPPPPPPRPRSFKVTQVSDGFTVTPGDKAAGQALLIDIHVAYDIRRGNPLGKYNPADFEVDKAPIKVATEGIALQVCNGNRVVALIHDSDFKISVTGFDPSRDLYIKANAEEQQVDGDQAA